MVSDYTDFGLKLFIFPT